MTDDELPDDNPAERAQAKALREQARAGGLRFEAYLPGSMADWLLAQIERGRFADPSEAVFLIVQNFIEMEPHRDLQDEYPSWSRAFWLPVAPFTQQRVCQDNDAPHDGGDSDLFCFSRRYELLIFVAEVMVEANSDQRRHVNCPSQRCPATDNPLFTLPLA